MADDELLDLERRGWDALCTEGAAADFYREVLARRVLMLFPGGMVIDDRDAVISSMSGPPWRSYELDDTRVLRLTDDTAVVAYRATAVREDEPYTALIASTYVREDGAWKLAVHQQTPV
jgi:hypothetical protein